MIKVLFFIFACCTLAFADLALVTKLVSTGFIGSGTQEFGHSVAISTDGLTLAVGSFIDNAGVGAGWIFVNSGGSWVYQAKLLGSDHIGASMQGIRVALNADGNTFSLGGFRDDGGIGANWIFVRAGSSWTQQAKLIGTGNVGGSNQGVDVALTADGNTAISGGYMDNNYAGAVWVFSRTGTSWNQLGSKLVASSAIGNAYMGISVAISADGNYIVGGSMNDNSDAGAGFIYFLSGGTYSQQQKVVSSDNVGSPGMCYGVAISSDGSTIACGGYQDNGNVGATWIFVRTGTSWAQQGAKLIGAGGVGGGNQGFSVDISSDGNTVAAGANQDNTNMGAVYVFHRSGSTWTEVGSKIVPGVGEFVGPIMQFGKGVRMSGDGQAVVIGGPSESAAMGAAWVYENQADPTAAPTGPAIRTNSIRFRVHGLHSGDFLVADGALTQALKLTMAEVLGVHVNKVYHMFLQNELNRFHLPKNVLRIHVYVRAESSDFTVLSISDTFQYRMLTALHDGSFWTKLESEATVFGISIPEGARMLGDVITTQDV